MNKQKPFIIAEIGNNHEGSLKNAKKMINLASKAGVDAVKFQIYKTEHFIHPNETKRYKQLKKFELSYKDFTILKKHAKINKIKFIASAFDFESLKFALKITDFIKIASGDNNFFPLIEKAIKSRQKIIISTGMTNIENLNYLKQFLIKKLGSRKYNEKIIFLHCVSSYPVLDYEANLNSIKYLKKILKTEIGYSDHTIGTNACIAAFVLGARVIEKHFTIDKNFSNFRDHKLSLDFNEMKKLVIAIKSIHKMLGKRKKEKNTKEKAIEKLARRNLYAKKDILKGDKIDSSFINFLRPANSNNFKLINKKIYFTSKKKNKKKLFS